jgi:glycosyltransferase involved in cell wall biosynthesis
MSADIAAWVVIPAYNEAATIRSVVEGALAYVGNVIVVDDASTDGTAGLLGELPVTLLRHDSNQGKAASLWFGLNHAVASGADRVLTMDADGQHHAEDIPVLLKTAREYPASLIVGSRFHSPEAIPTGRRRSNRVANFWIGWASGQAIADSQSGFRVYPAGLIRRARIKVDLSHSFVFESEIIIEAARLGFSYQPAPIGVTYRAGARPSYFRPVADIARITRMVAWKLISRGLYPQGLWRSLRAGRL